MDAVVRVRIDAKAKKDTQAILSAAGLTMSDAVRLMMIRIVAEGRLPFDPLVLNAETIEAMQAADRDELTTVGGVKDLMAELNAEH